MFVLPVFLHPPLFAVHWVLLTCSFLSFICSLTQLMKGEFRSPTYHYLFPLSRSFNGQPHTKRSSNLVCQTPFCPRWQVLRYLEVMLTQVVLERLQTLWRRGQFKKQTSVYQIVIIKSYSPSNMSSHCVDAPLIDYHIVSRWWVLCSVWLWETSSV